MNFDESELAGSTAVKLLYGPRDIFKYILYMCWDKFLVSLKAGENTFFYLWPENNVFVSVAKKIVVLKFFS